MPGFELMMFQFFHEPFQVLDGKGPGTVRLDGSSTHGAAARENLVAFAFGM